MSATIRPALDDDLAAVMRIEVASFPTDAWTESAMRQTLELGDSLIAERDDAVVGYAAVIAPEGSGDADVLTLAVAEEHRGAGIGRALLERLIAIAAERGAGRVFLEVRADNPIAEGLYTARGFRRVGRRPHYYQPDDVDAIVMRLQLPLFTEHDEHRLARRDKDALFDQAE